MLNPDVYSPTHTSKREIRTLSQLAVGTSIPERVPPPLIPQLTTLAFLLRSKWWNPQISPLFHTFTQTHTITTPSTCCIKPSAHSRKIHFAPLSREMWGTHTTRIWKRKWDLHNLPLSHLSTHHSNSSGMQCQRVSVLSCFPMPLFLKTYKTL